MTAISSSLYEAGGTALTLAATLLGYRFAVSPAVRYLSRRAAAGQPSTFTPRRRVGVSISITASALLPALLVPAGAVPDAGHLRWFLLFVITLLTWRFVTVDYDLTRPTTPQIRARLLVVALGMGACLWPPVLLAWLAAACGRLDAWQHHAMMPLRILKAYLAWFFVASGAAAATLVSGQWLSGGDAGLLLVIGCVSLSHYLKPAWSKARLGPRWWSWAWHNRTHYLMASAYCWGWARFFPPRTALRILRIARRLDRPINIATVIVEVAALLAFSDRWALAAVLVATAAFNFSVAVASGIFFWENICINLTLAATVATLPAAAYAPAFGWSGALLAVPILLLTVVDLLWQPWHLGWWDAPFTARVHWEVETTSGLRRGLYNDFMCPYEREFGRVLGYFLTREPVIHGHLGIVWDRKLRDRVIHVDGDPAALEALKREHGLVQWDPKEGQAHIAFLTEMFARLNAGARKGPLPPALRRLKAPGGQLYYWGDLPPYRGDEPVRRIIIRYQERCYRPSANDLVLLNNRVLHEIDLSA